MAVAWELPPADLVGPFRPRFDDREPEPVPAVLVKDYRGHPGSGRRAVRDSDLLVEVKQYRRY